MASDAPTTPKKKQRLAAFTSGRGSPLRNLGSMLSPSKFSSSSLLSRTPDSSREKKRTRETTETKENGSNAEPTVEELYMKEHGALDCPLSPRSTDDVNSTWRRTRNTIRLSTGHFSHNIKGSISQASSQVSLTLRSAKKHVYTDVRSLFAAKDERDADPSLLLAPEPRLPGMVFGRDLVDTMKAQINEHPALAIPLLVKDCTDYIIKNGLQTTGIFRLSASAVEVERLATLYDLGEHVDLEAEIKDIHLACCLLKKYLRELPQPLIPLQLEPEIQKLELGALVDDEASLLRIRDTIVNSPLVHPCHYNTLKHIIRLCALVASEASVNKMDSSNLAVVFGPNLQPSPVPDAPASSSQTTASDLLALMAKGGNPQAHVNHLVHILIANADFFFPPS